MVPGQKSAQQCNFEQKLFWIPEIEGHLFQLGFHFKSCDLLFKIGLTDIHHCEFNKQRHVFDEQHFSGLSPVSKRKIQIKDTFSVCSSEIMIQMT